MTTDPEPPPAVRIRLDCSFRAPVGPVTLYADMSELGLAAVLDLLNRCQEGNLPASTLLEITARRDRDDEQSNLLQEIRAWRVVRIATDPDGVVLYERRRREAADVSQPEAKDEVDRRAQLDYWDTRRRLDALIPGWSDHHTLATAVDALARTHVKWAGADQVAAELARVGLEAAATDEKGERHAG